MHAKTCASTVGLAMVLTATTALSSPKVVTDIPPVHSLVTAVMEGVGTPILLVEGNSSPHHVALKPSQALALEQADVVFAIGHELTPWLFEASENLVQEGAMLELSEVEGTSKLPIRAGGRFEAHDHSDHDDDHAEHGEKHDDEHAEHDHKHDDEHAEHDEKHDDEHAEHDHKHDDDHAEHGEKHDDEHAEHDHKHDDDHAHDAHEGSVDPHLWLDPHNAQEWLRVIAATLSNADPANAEQYAANAQAAHEKLASLQTDISAKLEPVRDIPFIVFHDAYQYYETAFDLSASGSIALNDAEQPSAARIVEIKETLAESGAVCVFAEPQFDKRLVETVIEGGAARSGVLDPLGADIAPGADHYEALLRDLTDSLVTCLSG